MNTNLISLDEVIKNAVNERLEHFHGNQSAAARSLEITRVTLRKYMDKKYQKHKHMHQKDETGDLLLYT